MKIVTRFLSAGPGLELDLPDGLVQVPDSFSPFSLDGGLGARTFGYTNELTMAENQPHWGSPSQTGSAESGSYEIFADKTRVPFMWQIRWPLQRGCIWTHVREEDGWARVEQTLSAVRIVEDDGMPPSLPAVPPLRREVGTTPTHKDELSFRAVGGSEDDLNVYLLRPFPKGRSQTVEDGSGRNPATIGASDLGIGVGVSGKRSLAELDALRDAITVSIRQV